MDPCVFRMPFTFEGADEASLLANVRAFFAAITPPAAPAYSQPEVTEQLVRQVMNRLITDFDFVPFTNPQQMRNYVTNNLLEIASGPHSDSARLKALELLGKLKDVGLFEERSTILVEHMTTDQLKTALKSKVLRLREKTLEAETVDTTTKEITHE